MADDELDIDALDLDSPQFDHVLSFVLSDHDLSARLLRNLLKDESFAFSAVCTSIKMMFVDYAEKLLLRLTQRLEEKFHENSKYDSRLQRKIIIVQRFLRVVQSVEPTVFTLWAKQTIFDDNFEAMLKALVRGRIMDKQDFLELCLEDVNTEILETLANNARKGGPKEKFAGLDTIIAENPDATGEELKNLYNKRFPKREQIRDADQARRLKSDRKPKK